MVELRFDYRDIFRSARLAFSLQRLWMQFLGLVVGYIGYLILTYVSLLAGGMSLSESWARFGLLPYLFGLEAPWYSWIIYAVGGLFLLACYLLANTAVARASYMVLKGNTFYTWREAFSFAFKKAGAVLLSPGAIFSMGAFFVVGAWIIGLLGRIPYVGWLGLPLFTFFWVVAAVFLFFLAVILGVSILLVPAIIATTDEDAFEAVFQTFSSVWSQPWRFVVYEVLLGIITVAGFVALSWGVKQGFLIMGDLFAFSMRDKFIDIANHGQYLLQSWVFISQDWINRAFGGLAPYIYFQREFVPSQDLSAVLTVSSYFFAISLAIVGGWVLTYPASIFSVGNTLIYLVLRKKKDDENLLERKDKEEEEEEKEEVKEEKVEEKAEAEKEEEKAEAEKSEEKGEESK